MENPKNVESMVRKKLISSIAAAFVAQLALSGSCNAVVLPPYTALYQDQIGPFSAPAGSGGSATWKTTVELSVNAPNYVNDVPQVYVGDVNKFTIRGDVTNDAGGPISFANQPATVFGYSRYPTNNVENAQPFTSNIRLVGTSRDKFSRDKFTGTWSVQANDHASSEEIDLSETVPKVGLGATAKPINETPSVPDWFEVTDAAPASNHSMVAVNRVLSDQNYGKFTGTGGHFQITGFFQDSEPGTSALIFDSMATEDTL